MLHGQAQRARTVGCHDERDPRVLNRPGPCASVHSREVRATVRNVVLGQQPVKQLGELAESVEAFPWRQRLPAENGGIDVASGTDAAHQPASGDVVQGQQVTHERHRVAVVRRADKCAQGDRRGDHGCGRQRGDGAEPGRVRQPAPDQVVVGPGMVKAELLSTTPHRGRLRPAALRQDRQAKSHGCRLVRRDRQQPCQGGPLPAGVHCAAGQSAGPVRRSGDQI